MVIFCADVSKEDWAEDLAIFELARAGTLILVATKADLLGADLLAKRLAKLERVFGKDFLPISVETGFGLERLSAKIDEELIDLAGLGAKGGFAESNHQIALTARHRQAVTEAVESLEEAGSELKAGNDEIAAMMLRAGYQSLANIEREHVDEKLLENIFGRFCIGK